MPSTVVNSLLRAAVDNVSPREEELAFGQVQRSSSAKAALSVTPPSKGRTRTAIKESIRNDAGEGGLDKPSRQASNDDILISRRSIFQARKKSIGLSSMQHLPIAATVTRSVASAGDVQDQVTTPRVDESSSTPLNMKIAVSTMEQWAAAWDAFRLHSDTSKRQFHSRGVTLLDGGLEAVVSSGIDAILCPLTSPFGTLDTGNWTSGVMRRVGFAVEQQLLAKLQLEFFGEAPPGAAILVATQSTDGPAFVVFAFLGSTETSEYPSNYVYASLRGALLAIGRHNDESLKKGSSAPIKSVGLPFFTAWGRVAALELPHCEVARQMALALDTTPTYVFSSYKAALARTIALPDRKEQQRRIRAQTATDDQLRRAVSKAVARAVRKGVLEDFALRGFSAPLEIAKLADLADRAPPKPGSKLHLRATDALCSMLRFSAWERPSLSCTRSMVLEVLRERVTLYYRLTKMPLEAILDRVEEERFEIIDKIASGGTATVFKARDRQNGSLRALKMFRDDSDLDAFQKEASTATLLDSPYITPTLAFGDYRDERGVSLPFLVLPYKTNGSLFHVLHVQKKRFDHNTAVMMAVRIARAVDYLHQRSIIHRDMKSANVLLGEDFKPQLTDFGTSKLALGQQHMTNMVGTLAWMAPEVFETTVYSQKADVYSFAMILFELFMGEQPFANVHSFALPGEVMKGIRPQINKALVPKPIARIIKACWQANPAKRPDISKALASLVQIQQSITVD